jgi:hypothetical protein
MGSVVLDPGVPKTDTLRIYAHCSKEGKGAVALVALNIDTEHEQAFPLPMDAQEMSLTAPALTSATVMLNGKELRAEPDGSIRPLEANEVKKGVVRLAPASVTFLTIPSANNKSCE